MFKGNWGKVENFNLWNLIGQQANDVIEQHRKESDDWPSIVINSETFLPKWQQFCATFSQTNFTCGDSGVFFCFKARQKYYSYFSNKWGNPCFFLKMGTLKCVCSYLSRDIRPNQLEHTLLRVPIEEREVLFSKRRIFQTFWKTDSCN